jgi:hypothetical protein
MLEMKKAFLEKKVAEGVAHTGKGRRNSGCSGTEPCIL